MSNKKYYWLKLKDDFFEDDTIQWLEEQENGKDYVIYYLKLALKSLTDNGTLIRFVGEKLIPYDVKALAKLTDTPVDTVAVAMKTFEQIGLISVSEVGEIYLNQINELIGSETFGARRVRKHRLLNTLNNEENEVALQCNKSVTQSVTLEIRDKEIRDKEIKNKDIVSASADTQQPQPKSNRRFVKPTVEQISEYCLSRQNGIDAQYFYDYYESKGWVVGKAPMKNWQSAIRTWEKNNKNFNGKGKKQNGNEGSNDGIGFQL